MKYTPYTANYPHLKSDLFGSDVHTPHNVLFAFTIRKHRQNIMRCIYILYENIFNSLHYNPL